MMKKMPKEMCCGCRACELKCPKKCISMKCDSEGFLYPNVDEALCVKCGVCERVCPVKNSYAERVPLVGMAFCNKDESVRKASSSGGFFSCLADHFLAQNGVVFGAKFDESWKVVLDYADSLDALRLFKGSKYVQADTGTSYVKCENFLKSGKMVLFSGTPCQISGLLHYLKKDYDNLLTCDVACHGVPSPKVWESYLKEAVCANEWARIKKINFRDKVSGWRNFSFSISLENPEKSIVDAHKQNAYMKAFLANLSLRPSCYDCKMKNSRSHSDITIADLWGVDNIRPELNDDKGISLVLLNSDKGKKIVESMQIDCVEVDYAQCLQYNTALSNSVEPHPNRKRFFSKLSSAESMSALVENSLAPSLSLNSKIFLGKVKKKVARLLKM